MAGKMFTIFVGRWEIKEGGGFGDGELEDLCDHRD